jgi:hypothetical protein
MTDTEDWKERREQLLRYRAMEQESTDPLAVGLLHDIVLELQADLQSMSTGNMTGATGECGIGVSCRVH